MPQPLLLVPLIGKQSTLVSSTTFIITYSSVETKSHEEYVNMGPLQFGYSYGAQYDHPAGYQLQRCRAHICIGVLLDCALI